MSWPLSQDYNEAIQSPATNFSDPDLKKGQVVTNALGLPIPFSGNFADVYQVRCPDGSRWAVKCFTREAPGLRERYQEISAWLSKAKLPFSVDFAYLEQGIRVAGKWYPILKMQWVEGLTLNQFVAQYLDKPAMLEALLQLWVKMGKFLRAAKVGHCDLQHGNVLLVPGSTPNALALKLIDYDGMWVPALAKTKSGEVGHANYQHPRRLREGTYSLEVDRFPLLLVATAMRALKADKGLWAKYDNGDNLLFKESDLAAPGQSPLFEDLASLPDAGLVMLAAQVRAALKGPLESTALLEEAMPETKAPVASTRPSKLVTGAPSGTGARSNPRSPSGVALAAATDALAFDAVSDGATASFIRKRDLAKVKQESSASGIPIAAWIGGAVAVALLGIVGGVALWAMSRKAPPPDTPIVQKTGPTTVPAEPNDPPMKVDPAGDNPPGDPPVVTPPVVVAKEPDEMPADKPGARVVRTYDWRYTGGVRAVSFSQDGATALALGVDGVLTQFNPRTGQSMHSTAGLGYPVKCAVLTPDGLKAVIAGGDNKIHVRDMEEGKDVESLSGDAGGLINWVDVAADGKLAILGGDDGMITLWDLQRGAAKKMWKGSEKAISVVRFSPDGKSALSCGQDEIVHIWNTADGSETFTIAAFQPGNPAKPLTAVFLTDAKVFVGFTAAARGIWDLKTRRMINGGRGGGSEMNRTVAASPDGRLTAMAAGMQPGFTLFDQKKPGAYNAPTPILAPYCLAFAPNSRHLLAGCTDGTLHYVAVTLPGEEAAAIAKMGDRPPGLPFDVGWDKSVDPDGDCKFLVEKDALTIEVPAKDHDLGAERNVMNAPRLLRDVEGDFTAQVRLTGDFDPVGPSTAVGHVPFAGAGLVLMVDDRTYLRLERAGGAFNGAAAGSPYINWEMRTDGKMARIVGVRPVITADKPTYLRLQRKGAQLLASVSQDGENWMALPPVNMPLLSPMKSVKIGVAAGSSSAMPFRPHFDGFQLTADKTAVAVKPTPEKGRLKPPTGDDLAKAIAAVKQEFKADYDKLSTPKDRIDLANKLRAEAFASKDKQDRQYALYVEARDQAVRGEDFAVSQKIIDETAATFMIDAKEAKAAALFAVGPMFSNKAAAKSYLVEVGPLLQEARADDDYDHVAPLLPAVRKAAEVAHDAEMTRTAASLEKLQKEYEIVKKDVQTLKEKPDDPEANLAMGKFYCFQKQDWDKGSPFLVKSGNLALATTATKDVDAPTEVKEQVALADAWMKQGDNPTLGIRLGAHHRAYDWYTKALPNLSDKEEERVKARVTELTKLFPDVLAAWDNLDVSKVEAVGNAYLRVKPNQILSTKQPLEGPVEIVVVARAARAPFTFEFLKGNEPIEAWQVNPRNATGRRLSKGRTGAWDDRGFMFDPTVWATFTCKLQDARMECLVDGGVYFIDITKNDLSKERTFQLKVGNQTLEVKSFTVNPIEKP